MVTLCSSAVAKGLTRFICPVYPEPEYQLLMPPRPPKQIWCPVKTAITDRAKAPKGLNLNEPDLINDDLLSQIARCRERIKENFMPHVYKHKLEELLMEQKGRDLEHLESILKWAQSNADKYKITHNVEHAILAYRSGVLNWCHSFVTYWHNGTQLCAPRPGPSSQQAVIECGTGSRKWAAEISIALRIPIIGDEPPPGPFEFQFKDDTGADYMVLYDNDVELLRVNLQAKGTVYSIPPLLGVLVVTLGDGSKKAMLVRELEVNMWDEQQKQYMAASWDSIPVVVLPGRGTKRLNGPWMRWKFYTGTAPDNSNRLWIYDYNPTNPLMRGPRLPTETQAQMDRALPTAHKYESIGNHPQFNPDIPSGKSII
ncbi:uncharacterized protein N7518_008359 [Penicillium psychrosexuale]|uniref:uncharacterized protein n=1 Tax=Penicillium psychrosexuale TaxID=1002107 RepID=UPI002545535D|nr:uncharacterized protein N7518_008359 [Penicillium psychrosexuale]KAJ5791348.1 hypothetical protein N7518_008359 [Penicillium psychrosexuale]